MNDSVTQTRDLRTGTPVWASYGDPPITFSMVAAQIVRSLVCGKSDPDADLFAFR